MKPRLPRSICQESWEYLSQEDRVLWFDGFASAVEHFGLWIENQQLIGKHGYSVAEILKTQWMAMFPECDGYPCRGCDGCHGECINEEEA